MEDRARPCVAERADTGRDVGRPGLRQPADGRGNDRDRILMARPRSLYIPQRRRSGLSRHHGDHFHSGRRVHRHQLPGRHVVRVPRPAGGQAMTAIAIPQTVVVPASARRRWLRRYALAVAGGAVIVFWFAVALFAPVISPYNPEFVDIASRLQPPSHAHWLGTDALGRDVLSRVFYGSRISLIAGFSVVVISAVFGTVLGAIA